MTSSMVRGVGGGWEVDKKWNGPVQVKFLVTVENLFLVLIIGLPFRVIMYKAYIG